MSSASVRFPVCQCEPASQREQHVPPPSNPGGATRHSPIQVLTPFSGLSSGSRTSPFSLPRSGLSATVDPAPEAPEAQSGSGRPRLGSSLTLAAGVTAPGDGVMAYGNRPVGGGCNETARVKRTPSWKGTQGVRHVGKGWELVLV